MISCCVCWQDGWRAAEGRIVGTLEYETYNGEGDNTSGLVWRCESANADLNEMLETGPLRTGVDWADE